jgi:hypothetical protein
LSSARQNIRNSPEETLGGEGRGRGEERRERGERKVCGR